MKLDIVHIWGKFEDFSIVQILHEINFEDGRSAKIANFAISRAVDFVHLVDFSLKNEKNSL